MNDRDENNQTTTPPAHEEQAGGVKKPDNGEARREKTGADKAAKRPAGPPPSSPPPRGPKLWFVLLTVLGLTVALAAGVFFSGPISAGFSRVEQAVLVADEHDHAAEDDGQYWTCGMHPWVILPEPGLCPICHMELTPLDPAKLAGEISIDPVVIQNIGVRVASVETGPLEKEIRTVGTVSYNEEGVRVVNTKIGGWIEQLHVDETGVLVEEGQPLFEIYSPELFAAQQEYLSAYQNRTLPGGEELLEAARTRLEYFDISQAQIQQLQETGQAGKTLTITSPHTGIVTEKMASEGMRIDPGMRVYQIADLSTVWVQATVYEQDLPYVAVGQQAAMTLPYLPGEVFEGEVAYIYPYLNEQARQVRVRLEFPNPEGLLKPGMFATVRLDRTLDEEAVVVPRDAVVVTGEREVAFVSLGEGRFEPRELELGIETEDGLVEVLSGLQPGEVVVVSGQFMLDSEAKMRLALSKMIEGDLATEQAAPLPEEPTIQPELSAAPPELAEALTDVVNAYRAIAEKLVSNSTTGVADDARSLADALDALREVEIPGERDFWTGRTGLAAARGEALELAEAQDLSAMRLIYADVSHALLGLVEDTGVPPSGERMIALTCPMFPPGEGGAVWLQPAGPARNPYMGEGPMLRCSSDETLLPEMGAAPAVPGVEEAGEEIPPAEVPEHLRAAVAPLVKEYLEVHRLLSAGEPAGVEPRLEAVRLAALELAEAEDPVTRELAEDVAAEADSQPDELPAMRAAFKSLSEAVIDLVERVPPAMKGPLYRGYCPMAQAAWLQTAAEVQNPYYGENSDMYDCGELEPLRL